MLVRFRTRLIPALLSSSALERTVAAKAGPINIPSYRFSIGVEPDHAGRTGTGERWQRRRNKSGIAQGSGVCRWGERQMKKISNPHLCSVAGGGTREADWETGRQPSFTIKRKTRKMARNE